MDYIVYKNRPQWTGEHYADDKIPYCAACGKIIEDIAHSFCGWCGAPLTQPIPLTLEQLRKISTEPLKHWIWIENLRYPGNSGYMQNHSDWSDGEYFCCGWPGTGCSFKYDDYGKTWFAYVHKPHNPNSAGRE